VAKAAVDTRECYVVVKKGTLQSSFRKTTLSRGGKTAIPKHVRGALNLNSTPCREEGLMWIQRGDDVIVRKGTTPSRKTKLDSEASGVSWIRRIQPSRMYSNL